MINNILYFIGMGLLGLIPIFGAIIIFSADEESHSEKKRHHRKTKRKISRRHAH